MPSLPRVVPLLVLAMTAALLQLAAPAGAAPGVERSGHRPVMTVITANLWIGNPRVHAAKSTIRHHRPLVVGLQEGRETPAFRVPGYRTLGGPGTKRHNPVLVRRGSGIEVRDSYVVKVSESTGRGPLHVARYATVVRLRWADRAWTVVNTHLPVVSRTERPRPSTDRVAREFRAGFQKVLRITRREHDAGRRVVLLGDLNDMPRAGVPMWPWNPVKALPRSGLVHDRTGVDYVATTRRPAAFSHRRVIPRRHTGSDHEWLLAGVRW